MPPELTTSNIRSNGSSHVGITLLMYEPTWKRLKVVGVRILTDCEKEVYGLLANMAMPLDEGFVNIIKPLRLLRTPMGNTCFIEVMWSILGCKPTMRSGFMPDLLRIYPKLTRLIFSSSRRVKIEVLH